MYMCLLYILLTVGDEEKKQVVSTPPIPGI